MKLQLRSDRDIHILAVSGDLDANGFAVLRAGITKLFKTGKNRIILDLSQSKVQKPEPLRELAALNELARELAGEIVIAGAAEDVGKELRESAGPAGIVLVTDVATALHSFRSSVHAASQENEPVVIETLQPVAAAAAKSVAESTQTAKLEEHVLQLKTQLREKEAGGLTELRRENAILKDQNEQLKILIQRQLIERRSPTDEAAFIEKIRALETQVEEAMQKLVAAAK